MPLYEYRCSKCGKTFEAIQKFSDPPLAVHEGCGGPVERLISTSSFQLKGSGWYATDYAKSSSKPAESSSGAGEGKSESKQDAKPDTKADVKPAPESKAESKPAPASTKTD
jgi:putative FmdB family regulatory protein